ncbi:MAG: aminoacyl-tRNA hydrolase [Candidatus Magasanikbacteria bacterium CG10_big_fil_rev_8_21_14_0_10_40_10]|uniref:Peptidyl-tRNA hydrolase n=1 Tax=Candidatus Magasanikbacteria bacterium CG10_big_fil_rev_8_21_14_0_10_40_10 TaxID=1974648 RepID=A0A2M6W4C7_9BACT|nr:MAG: aminoacyl-tRNA hydrolase [Candidatus Magasanikbacteria bacterium CG10_big_fil_rev_8_21_14_0_10_40_10]
MRLIVGLGNPDKKYQNTRHNAGWLVLDELAKIHQTEFKPTKKFNALTCELKINSQSVLLLKPLTYMNNSGASVQTALDYYGLKTDQIMIIHDDKDIELGKIKFQANRSSAGHNGVQSIIDYLKTKDFKRVRVGVASEQINKVADTAKFVLAKFNRAEKPIIKQAVQQAVKTIEEWLAI